MTSGFRCDELSWERKILRSPQRNWWTRSLCCQKYVDTQPLLYCATVFKHFKIMVYNMKLKQLPLFQLQIFDPIQPLKCWWGRTLVLGDEVWLTVASLVNCKGLRWGWGQDSGKTFSLWTRLCARQHSLSYTELKYNCNTCFCSYLSQVEYLRLFYATKTYFSEDLDDDVGCVLYMICSCDVGWMYCQIQWKDIGVVLCCCEHYCSQYTNNTLPHKPVIPSALCRVIKHYYSLQSDLSLWWSQDTPV